MSIAPIRKWQEEYTKERKEHPTLPPWAVRVIVQDHMKKKR